MNSLADFIKTSDLSQTENLELIARHVVDGFLSGRHRSKLKGGCAEFAEHRAYCPGDEIRLLDWRVFGKSDRYCIKQFEEQTSLQAIFALDASGSMGFGMSGPSKFEYARAACLCLARLVLQQGDAAGLAVIGGGIRSFVPPRTQPRHLELLIDGLRHAAPAGPTTIADDLGELARRIKRRGLIVLFSDCLADMEQLAHSLRLLRSRRHEVLLFHVMAPEELSFAFNNWSRFESLEVNGELVDLDPVSIRDDYLARIRTFLEQLRRVCGESQCDYVPLSTDKLLGVALADYLRRRSALAR
jgi:uncharacterized protein (DUF58 family)